MDEKDRLLLTHLQNGLPWVPRPFDAWATKLGMDKADLLVRIQRLKREGVLGGIKAIFDPQAFHYQSAWVAMRFGEPWKSQAETLWQHPGVIYGCEREHELNIWFYIAAPADHDLELHVRCLERFSSARQTLFLPVRRVFKGTDLLSLLSVGTFPAMNEHFEKRQKIRSLKLAEEEIGMIRKLQEAFPLTDEPYQRIATDLGVTEIQVLERMQSLVRQGCLKRIGSFLRPSPVCGEARTLVVWQIPEEKLERIGPEIAGFREVLYADRRPVYPEFPYSLYTMIRAKTSAELEVTARRIQDRIGKWPHRVMETIRELKKEPMTYFPKELDVWWQQSRSMAEVTFAD